MVEKSIPDYIHRTLVRIGEENGFKDYSIEVKKGSEAGDGFASEIASVDILERNGEKKLHLVCKMAPENENRRREFRAEELFTREATFYNTVLSSYTKFQTEKKLSKADQFLSYPKCYAAVADKKNQQYFLILEDLRPRGFKLWEKQKPSPASNARLALSELGKLHGLSIAMKHQKPKEFAEFQKITDLFKVFMKSDSLKGMFDASFDRAINSLRKEEHKNIYRELKKDPMPYFASTLDENNPFAVLSHGDFWNNNMLFKFNEDGIAEDIRILDWQIIRYVSPAIDLVYNLFTSTDQAVREKEYDNLLQIYYKSLSKTVRLLGSNPDELFTFANLQDELKLCGNYALLMAPLLIQILMADTSEIADLDEVFDKVADGDNRPELTTGLNDKAQLKYERRLSETVEDILKLGYYRKLV